MFLITNNKYAIIQLALCNLHNFEKYKIFGSFLAIFQVALTTSQLFYENTFQIVQMPSSLQSLIKKVHYILLGIGSITRA